MLNTVLLLFHAVFAAVWVGGMFFAYMALRPVAGGLEPPVRLTLWRGVFKKFFIWVWHAVVILPLTGYALLFTVFGGFRGAALHIHLMQGFAILMIVLFVWLFFGPYKRLGTAVAAEDWPAAGTALATIRKIVAVNLAIGLITVAIGASGRFWGVGLPDIM